MPCGTTIQWQPSSFTSAPLASAANTPCGPPSKLSSSPAINALSASWSSLNCEISILRPCFFAKSRVDTIRKMPASAFALIKPCFQTFSCATLGATRLVNAAAAATAASPILRVFMHHPPWHRALTASVSRCSFGILASFGRAARRQLVPPKQLSRREPSNVRAHSLYKAWHSRVVPRRHDVHTRNANHIAQVANDVGADPDPFGHRISCLLHATDQRIRNNRPEQFLLDPARRLR